MPPLSYERCCFREEACRSRGSPAKAYRFLWRLKHLSTDWQRWIEPLQKRLRRSSEVYASRLLLGHTLAGSAVQGDVNWMGYEKAHWSTCELLLVN